MKQPERLKELQNNSTVLLSKIRASGALGVSKRRYRLLEYLITEELSGRGDRIKAYSIGVDIFGKDDDFDPSTNNTVRVEMGRLREALTQFYANNDTADLIHIEIPIGTYQPIINLLPQTQDTSTESAPKTPASETYGNTDNRKRNFKQDVFLLLGVTISAIILFMIYSPNSSIWPFGSAQRDAELQTENARIPITIRNFKNLSANENISLIATSLSDDLGIALTRNKSLAVTDVGKTQSGTKLSPKNRQNDGLVIDGYIREFSGNLHIVIELIDNKTELLIWAHAFHTDHGEIEEDQDKVVNKIAGELRTQLYNASHRIVAGDDPMELSPWELYLIATWLPGEPKSTLAIEKKRIELARFALELQADFGQAHSVLADKLSYLASIDPLSNSPELLKEANYHAQKAMQLAPQDADVLFNLSMYEWHTGHLDKATSSLKRTLELDPSHTLAQILINVFPYSCTPAPHSTLEAVREHDASLSPSNPTRWLTLTSLTILHMNRGELEQALATEKRTHQIFQTPGTIIRMAAIMNQLGDLEGAKNLIASQKANWPNLNATHFANVTMPRRCSEVDAKSLLDMYRDLAITLDE